MKAITISIINNKGGVGKTSSTAIFAELMAFLVSDGTLWEGQTAL